MSKADIAKLLEPTSTGGVVPAVTLFDTGLWKSQSLRAFFGKRFIIDLGLIPGACTVRIGWGVKASGRRAEAIAIRQGEKYCLLEDGFLRSYGCGFDVPSLSLVMDDIGIYYDASRASKLELMLNDDEKSFDDTIKVASAAKRILLQNYLTKYNHAEMCSKLYMRPGDSSRVLVVDQTVGDLSVTLGGATSATFAQMLEAARKENPESTIYIKTHPVVSKGIKSGFYTNIKDDGSTVVLRTPINPLDLIEQMDRVYVVTSTMGFEALLVGKPVSCFGIPWYAGWGVTDDRQKCSRRTRKRSVDELFSAAYLEYTRYLDPETHKIGTIFDVMNWLVRQREMMTRLHGESGQGRTVGFGFRRWKVANLGRLLTLDQQRLFWVKDYEEARALEPSSNDSLLFWGATPPNGLANLSKETGARLLRVEDGFVRSVGLGSDFIPPRSLVLDRRGIYFDPRQPSDLEVLLNETSFTAEELVEARKVREFMVTHGITKYNLEKRCKPSWQSLGKRVVLVPGQVEDDASIFFGAGPVKTNLALLKTVRQGYPDAYIVYKPHPDVTSGNRFGRVVLKEALRWADYVERDCSVVSCLEACDEVHTMTSLTGFDALLRGIKVVVYGQPFYAGWGLTHDTMPHDEAVAFQRRKRMLSLDELVAGAMLRYPLYWDPVLKGYTTCMAVLRQILAERQRLEANGGLERLRSGWFRRQGRKVSVQIRALLIGYR